MSFFSKKNKSGNLRKASVGEIVDQPYSDFLDSGKFVHFFVNSKWEGREQNYFVDRITKILPDSAYGMTHEAIVSRAMSQKTFNAEFRIEDRVIVRSSVSGDWFSYENLN